MIDQKQINQIKELLEVTQFWNNGAGLIIPEPIAKVLKEHGIHGPYTVQKPIPMSGLARSVRDTLN